MLYIFFAAVYATNCHNCLLTDSNRPGNDATPNVISGNPYGLSHLFLFWTQAMLTISGDKVADKTELVTILGLSPDGPGNIVLWTTPDGVGNVFLSVHVQLKTDMANGLSFLRACARTLRRRRRLRRVIFGWLGVFRISTSASKRRRCY